MPLPGEHSCRLVEPPQDKGTKWSRMKSGALSIILFRKPGDKTTTAQTFRYPIEDWTEEEARKHCKKNDGKFEPAKKGDGEGE